jgi:hypothetical protein
MITILSAIFCLRAACYWAVIPTPITLDESTCRYNGRYLAENQAPNWKVVYVDCSSGRAA